MRAPSILTSLALAGCHWVFALEPAPTSEPDARDDALPPGSCPASARLCLDFENTTGDSSTYMHHPSTANINYTDREDERAADLGSMAQIYVGATANLGDLGDSTLEMWVRPRPTQPAMIVPLFDDPTNVGLLFTPIGVVTDEVRCSQGDVLAPAGYLIPRTAWVHVACVYTGAHLQTYVNGNRVQCAAVTNPAQPRIQIAIGYKFPDGARFAGAIDDVHLYDVALEEHDICSLGGDGNCAHVICP